MRPALLGDELTIYTWIGGITGPVSLRRYAITKAGKIVTRGATEWAHIDFVTKRVAPLTPELLADFQVVPADDPELKALGIARPVRWVPTGVEKAA